MQPLLSDAAIADQAATMTHRSSQRIDIGLFDMQDDPPPGEPDTSVPHNRDRQS